MASRITYRVATVSALGVVVGGTFTAKGAALRAARKAAVAAGAPSRVTRLTVAVARFRGLTVEVGEPILETVARFGHNGRPLGVPVVRVPYMGAVRKVAPRPRLTAPTLFAGGSR